MPSNIIFTFLTSFIKFFKVFSVGTWLFMEPSDIIVSTFWRTSIAFLKFLSSAKGSHQMCKYIWICDTRCM